VKIDKILLVLNEFREVEKDPKGTSTPQMRERWSCYEGKKGHIARTRRRSEEFQVMTGIRAHFAGQISLFKIEAVCER